MSALMFLDKARKRLMNKIFDGGVADNSHQLILPANTTVNLTAIDRVAGSIMYDTTANSIVFDNGSSLITVDSDGSAVQSFNGRTGVVTPQTGDYTKTNVGLANVDNTSDANKPVSTATQTALNLKVNTSAVIDIAHGGTGQITAGAAFNALSPMTTGGDLIYGGASGVGTRLANGTAGQVLTSNGTTLAPSWQAGGGGSFDPEAIDAGLLFAAAIPGQLRTANATGGANSEDITIRPGSIVNGIAGKLVLGAGEVLGGGDGNIIELLSQTLPVADGTISLGNNSNRWVDVSTLAMHTNEIYNQTDPTAIINVLGADLKDGSNVSSVTWGTRLLTASDATVALDWDSGVMINDATGTLAINAPNRALLGTDGLTTVLDWSQADIVTFTRLVATAPTTPTSAGVQGDIYAALDGTFVYVCYANNSWTRIIGNTSW